VFTPARWDPAGSSGRFVSRPVNRLPYQEDYWPLSDQQVHCRLLGPNALLIHASKPTTQTRC
jgi:hypothetical protein